MSKGIPSKKLKGSKTCSQPFINKVTSYESDSSHHEPIHAAILYHGDPQATF